MTKLTPFDAMDYLDDEEMMAAYLSAVPDDPAPDMFLIAVKNVARAEDMAQLARTTGLGHEGT